MHKYLVGLFVWQVLFLHEWEMVWAFLGCQFQTKPDTVNTQRNAHIVSDLLVDVSEALKYVLNLVQFYLPQPSEAYILHYLDHKLHPRKHMTSALVTQNLGNSFPLLVWYMFSKKMESKQLSSYSYLLPCSLVTASLVVPVVEEEPAVTVPCPHRCAISPRNFTQVFYFFGFYMSSFTCGLSQK